MMTEAVSLTQLCHILEETCKKAKSILNLSSTSLSKGDELFVRAREITEQTLNNHYILKNQLGEILKSLEKDNAWMLYPEHGENFDDIQEQAANLQQMLSEIECLKRNLDVFFADNVFDRKKYKRNLKTALGLMKRLFLRSILTDAIPNIGYLFQPTLMDDFGNNLISACPEMEEALYRMMRKVAKNMSSCSRLLTSQKKFMQKMFRISKQANERGSALTIINAWGKRMKMAFEDDLLYFSDIVHVCEKLSENYNAMQNIAETFCRMKFNENQMKEFKVYIKENFVINRFPFAHSG